MKKLLLILFTFFTSAVYAQPSLKAMKLKLDQQEALQPTGSEMKFTNSTQASIFFRDKTLLKQTDAVTWISAQLGLRQNIDALNPTGSGVITRDFTVNKVQQYYKGIKVEHGVINATSIKGDLASLQMEFYSIPDKFKTAPVLSEQDALNKAMQFTGAVVYAWQGYDHADADNQVPRGELVIIRTYKNEDEVCLAYKFNIYAKQPLSREYVYVNAWDGTVVLNDPIIKHLNETATISGNELQTGATTNLIYNNERTILPPSSPVNLDDTIRNRSAFADTRYNGRKIITVDSAGIDLKAYRLRQNRNGQKIITLDYQRLPSNSAANNEALAIDFTDFDNNWSSAEYANTNMDNAALDVHHSMQFISDYWINIHSRNGWNNANGKILSYVHVAENLYDNNNVYTGFNRWYDNAYWNGSNMHFGDGNGNTHTALTTLDISAHEMGHAITESTSSLVYRWESGALNEGFSDIWAACVTNYAVQKDLSLTGELTWRIGEKCWNNTGGLPPGLRDMQTPRLYKHPNTYNHTDSGWRAATYVTCPVPNGNAGGNDDCGVHYNSGVLNKWFFLITQGEDGQNSRGTPYSVSGMGFTKSEKIAYLMELNLTPNACFATAKNVSIYAAANLYGYQSAELQIVKDAWLAVGVDTSIYNMANTPVFTSNNFSSIEVATDGYVWAGTSYSGLYRFNGTAWEKIPELLDVKINDIKSDGLGGVWIAQSGKSGQIGGGSSIAGGLNYYATSATNTSTLYTVDVQAHVPTRNARCVFIDRTRVNDGLYNKVWMAGTAYITSGNSTSGMLGQGLYKTYKEFLPVNQGINIASGTVGCLTVGGNANEIWTFVQANNGVNQLLTYNAETNALITTYDASNVPEALPSGFVARAIYGDSKNRMWVGLANGGVRVKDELNIWHTINYPSFFPSGNPVNFNAITGDEYGDVYIGTSAGLLFFDAGTGSRTRLDSIEYFRMYGMPNGLPSNNINAIAYDATRFKVMVATDSGIVFWDPICLGNSCNLKRTGLNNYSESKGNGNWSNAAVWSAGMVPDSATTVVIKDSIIVDITAKCQSLLVQKPGSIKINPGLNLKIFEIPGPIMTNKEKKKRPR